MTFPHLERVFGLFINRARAAGNTRPWIVKVLSMAPQEHSLQRLERFVQALPAIQCKEVERRFCQIIPASSEQWHEEYDEQFREAVVELFGWDWLRKRHPAHKTGYYPRSGKVGERTPDLGVWNGDILLAAMECKKINVSQEEKAWLQSKSGTLKSGTIRAPFNLDSTSPFAKKLGATIEVAICQLDSTNLSGGKFILMSISLDTPLWIGPAKSSIKQFLRGQARGLRTNGIELIAFEGFWLDRPLV